MIGVIADQLGLQMVDNGQCQLWAVQLGDRDGPVESDDRRGVEADELVIEGDDLKTQWPCALSRWLNALMATLSAWVPNSFLSWITETRYCISDRPSLAKMISCEACQC